MVEKNHPLATISSSRFSTSTLTTIFVKEKATTEFTTASAFMSTQILFHLSPSYLYFFPLSHPFPLALMAKRSREHTSFHVRSGTHTWSRITGDGRCLFRSVAYGACIRSGKPSPSEKLQKELADELRSKVADEFVKRRGDTEWFLEGDFESYVTQMRKPHIWGGEPELLMCCHVLRMPISVYMYTKNSDREGPKIIAEYGQEYGKEDPIRVLYDGYGHYDALQDPIRRTTSRS